MTGAVAKVACLVVAVAGLRQRREASSAVADETQSARNVELWTFGAPQTFSPALDSPSGGCVPGARVVTTNNFLYDKVDNVAILLGGRFEFRHPTTDILALDQRNRGEWRDCPGNEPPLGQPSIILHDRFIYLTRSMVQGNPTLFHMAVIGANHSFNPDQAEVAQSVRQTINWRLVDTAYQTPEVLSQFFQHPDTLECAITFQGTSRFEDWIDNAKIVKVNYCGLEQKVHLGFLDAFRKMAGSDDWQQKIKPHLGKCSKLYATGHSLGAAQATLFYGCASRAPAGDSDWELIKYTQQTPQRLPYK